MHTLGKDLTDTGVTRKDHELVTGGPYPFVRHPFYCAPMGRLTPPSFDRQCSSSKAEGAGFEPAWACARQFSRLVH